MKKVRASPLDEVRIKPGCELHGRWNLLEPTVGFLDASVVQQASQSSCVSGSLLTESGF